MVYTIEDVEQTLLIESVLENSYFLDNSINTFTASSIPVVTLDESGEFQVVDYSYIDRLSEEAEISLEEARGAIALSNNIPLESLVVAIHEHEIIMNPYIVNELAQYVITPISEDSLAYTFCEACVNAYVESGDEMWLEILCMNEADRSADISEIFNNKSMSHEDKQKAYRAIYNQDRSDVEDLAKRKKEAPWMFKNEKKQQEEERSQQNSSQNTQPTDQQNSGKSLFQRGKDFLSRKAGSVKQMADKGVEWAKKNPKKAGLIGAGVVAGGILAKKAYDNHQEQKQAELEYFERIRREAANKPKSWLGKKIASLRSIYQKYLAQSKGSNAGIIKKICGKILSVIDFLMKKMQSMAG